MDALNAIPSEMIQKSLKKYCFSNELDNTEDDELFFNDSDYTANSNKEKNDDVYDNVLMTQHEFNELFCASKSESEFERFK